ncbi:MAG: ThuA domain-containing protein [Planctomycetaceae bacterium]|jgi:hypothetical protein|nr:ThuA domain-containing protein [Planctomycetaceae bacterium]
MMKKFFVPLFLFAFAFVCAAQEQQWATFDGTPGKPGSGKKVVLISGDEEYRSEEILTQLGKILAQHHGFTCHVLYAIDPQTGEIDPCILDNIPGIELLKDADIAVMLLRFRDLPDSQMKPIDDFLKAGKPILGIRTSTHAFNDPPEKTYSHYSFNYDDHGGAWQQGFGRLVLGETWIDHHGIHGTESTRGIAAPGQENNKILRGCGDIYGPTDVYTVRLPLPEGCVPLVLGEVLTGMKSTDSPVEGPKNNPKLPIAWTKPYQLPDGKKGKAFTSTMGCAEDFSCEGFRRLLVNAIYWLADLENQIPERNMVGIVGNYEPLPMGFAKHKKGIKPHQERL